MELGACFRNAFLAATSAVAVGCDGMTDAEPFSPAVYVSLETGDTITLGENILIFGSLVDRQQPCEVEGLVFCREGGVPMYLPSMDIIHERFTYNEVSVFVDGNVSCSDPFIIFNFENDVYNARYYFTKAYGLVYFEFVYVDVPDLGEVTTFSYTLVNGTAINYHDIACNAEPTRD